MVCTLIGAITIGDYPLKKEYITLDWFPYAVVVGSVFVSTFVLIARTVQEFGISITSVVQRMSLLVTVSFAIIYFNETVNIYKIIGIILALAAVVLTSIQSSSSPVPRPPKNSAKWLIMLPIGTFIISGIIETVLQFVQLSVLKGEVGQVEFTTALFGTAATWGFLILLVNFMIGRMRFRWKDLLFGIILGIPNFGSIYFLLKALDVGWEASVIFPMNNVGVIAASAIIALLVFKEKLSLLNRAGIILAIIAIFLMSYTQIIINQ